MKQQSESLESIPGIGIKMAQVLKSIGIHRVRDLKHRNPERLYILLEKTVGAHVDKCVLYVFRAAVYYASHEEHDPDKLKWWNWKDKE
mgnify:CR=1 FL=1